ncbi:MAG: oligosaccharide flippase family protein [Planctomycetota bacterium]
MNAQTRSAIIVVSRAAETLGLVAMLAVLARWMSKETFGTYTQLQLVVTLLVTVCGLSLPSSLYYFVPKLGPGRRRELLTNTIIVAAGCGLLSAAIMVLASDGVAALFDNPRLAAIFRMFWLYPVARMFLMLGRPFFISIDRPVRGGGYLIATIAVEAGILIVLTVAGWPLERTLYYLVAVECALAIVMVADMARLSGRGGEAPQRRRSLLLGQLAYILPVFAATVVSVLGKYFDKLLISTYFEPAEFAVYAVGAMELPVFAVVTISVFNGIMPEMVTHWEKGNSAEALRLWKGAARKCSLVVYPVFAMFLVCAQDVIILLFGAPFREATWPFVIYLLVLPVRMAVYGAFLKAIGQTRAILIGALLAFTTNAIISFALIWLGGGGRLSFLGPSIGTAGSAYVVVVFYLRRMARATGQPVGEVMLWSKLGKILAVSLLCGGAVYLLPLGGLHVGVRLAVKVAVFGGAFFLVVWWGGILQEDEKRLLRRPMRAFGSR